MTQEGSALPANVHEDRSSLEGYHRAINGVVGDAIGAGKILHVGEGWMRLRKKWDNWE